MTCGGKSVNRCWGLQQTSALKNKATGKTPEEEIYAKELELWYEKDLDLKKALKDLKELIHEEFREMKEKEALRGQPVGQYYRLLVGYVIH